MEITPIKPTAMSNDTTSMQNPINNQTTKSGQKSTMHSINEYFTSNQTVRIYVGPEKKLWTLPEALLCEKIDFFRAAFKTKSKESIAKEFYLAEDDPGAFGKLVDWVFNDKVDCHVAHSSTESIDSSHEIEWIKTYILADKLRLDCVATQSLSGYQRCLAYAKTCVSAEAVKFVYAKTSSSSELRDMVARTTKDYFLANCPSGIRRFATATSSNTEFNLEVMTQLWEHSKRVECTYASCVVHKAC